MVIRASGGIILRDNQVLLVKRINAPRFNGLWSNPGGKAFDAESLEEACCRELREELAVEVKIVRMISAYDDYQGSELCGVYTGFLVQITKGEPVINEPDKIGEIRYWGLEQLPLDLAPYTRQYLADLKR